MSLHSSHRYCYASYFFHGCSTTSLSNYAKNKKLEFQVNRKKFIANLSKSLRKKWRMIGVYSSAIGSRKIIFIGDRMEIFLFPPDTFFIALYIG
jgi:hypothetical protein